MTSSAAASSTDCIAALVPVVWRRGIELLLTADHLSDGWRRNRASRSCADSDPNLHVCCAARPAVRRVQGAVATAGDALREELDRGATFGELAHRWWQGVEDGRIGKRKGRGGSGYSPNTLKGYERTLRTRLIPEFGGRTPRRSPSVTGSFESTGSARKGCLAHGWRTDPVAPTSVMSGKIARRTTAAWAAAGLNRITLHECRHTYASFLMAAGYTLKEIMGTPTCRWSSAYTKLLSQPQERDPVERLNAYLRRRRRQT
jgi:hypothetical protein